MGKGKQPRNIENVRHNLHTNYGHWLTTNPTLGVRENPH